MKIDVYYQGITQPDGTTYFLWAWKKSHDAKVYGRATSLDDIEKKARKMFPGCDIQLLSLSCENSIASSFNSLSH